MSTQKSGAAFRLRVYIDGSDREFVHHRVLNWVATQPPATSPIAYT
jgi:hypothetical protein